MKTLSGMSREEDAKKAVAEATKDWNPLVIPNIILVFHSSKQDAAAVASELSLRFPTVPVAGCTTTGEHLNGAHFNNSLVLTAIFSPEIKWSVKVIHDIKNLNIDVAKSSVDSMLKDLALDREQISAEKQFCMILIDGLSMKEEHVSAMIAEALEGIPLVGGSAGDDLKFKNTWIIADGKASENAAVLIMGDSTVPFHIIKHQHFIKTPKQLVITKVDTVARRVYEMDGMPAADVYAKLLGIPRKKLSNDDCFLNPLLFRVNNEIYIRSIQRIEDDGSLVFYCGLEEGMVLEIGGHESLTGALSEEIASLRKNGIEKAEVFIAFNCILRALETQNGNLHNNIGQLLSGISANVVGFDTYGEQLNGLHINQTLVGLALGRAA